MPDHPDPYQLRVGAATITIVNTGMAEWVLAEELHPPEAGWSADELARISQPAWLPFQCAHVALGDASIVVDAMDYAEWVNSNGTDAQEQRHAIPRLDAQLVSLGIAPERVTHVVITHAHRDHYNVATVVDEATGQRRLLFPNATYVAERADWTTEGQRVVEEPAPDGEQLGAYPARIMGEVFRQGRMHLVDGDVDLVPGVRLLAAPGESPGHAIVRVQSEGQTFYCLGDLFHASIEAEHLDAMAPWADRAKMLDSRRALVEAAVREDALLMAAHVSGLGRLRAQPDGRMVWEPAEV